MDFLGRETSPVAAELWRQIDEATVGVARNVLTGRRFLHLTGPLGAGVDSVAVDDAETKSEVTVDGIMTTKGRKLMQLPALFEDFTLYARDLAQSEKTGTPADLSAVLTAAQALALREDRLVYFGHAKLGYDGLLTAPGVIFSASAALLKEFSRAATSKARSAYSGGKDIHSLSVRFSYAVFVLSALGDLSLRSSDGNVISSSLSRDSSCARCASDKLLSSAFCVCVCTISACSIRSCPCGVRLTSVLRLSFGSAIRLISPCCSRWLSRFVIAPEVTNSDL